MSELAVVHLKLTADEARALTIEIRTDLMGIPQKILRAHDGEVWTPLGYETFREWAEKEYPQGIRRIYQLLNYARVERTIGSQELTNERQARPLIALAGQPEKQREVFAAAQANAAAAGEKLTATHVQTEVAKATGKPSRNGSAPEHAPAVPLEQALREPTSIVEDAVWQIDFNAEHATPAQLEEAISHLFGRLAPRKKLLVVVRLYHELDEAGRAQFNGLLEAASK